jgi:hypothetical protein
LSLFVFVEINAVDIVEASFNLAHSFTHALTSSFAAKSSLWLCAVLNPTYTLDHITYSVVNRVAMAVVSTKFSARYPMSRRRIIFDQSRKDQNVDVQIALRRDRHGSAGGRDGDEVFGFEVDSRVRWLLTSLVGDSLINIQNRVVNVLSPFSLDPTTVDARRNNIRIIGINVSTPQISS